MLPGPTFKDSDLIGAGCGLGISIFKVSWESIICRRENQFHCILCAFRPMDYASGCPVINRSSPLFSKMYKERGKQAGLPRVVIYCGKSVEIWGQVDLDLSLGQPLTKLCNLGKFTLEASKFNELWYAEYQAEGLSLNKGWCYLKTSLIVKTSDRFFCSLPSHPVSTRSQQCTTGGSKRVSHPCF